MVWPGGREIVLYIASSLQLHLHKSNVDMEEFYKNCIPKSNTPADYGGDCSSIEQLNEAYHRDLLGMREYFAWEEQQRHKDQNDNVIMNTKKWAIDSFLSSNYSVFMVIQQLYNIIYKGNKDTFMIF